jgi:hypothetical protein
MSLNSLFNVFAVFKNPVPGNHSGRCRRLGMIFWIAKKEEKNQRMYSATYRLGGWDKRL